MDKRLCDQFIQALHHCEHSKDVRPLVRLFADDATLENRALRVSDGTVNGVEKFWQSYLDSFSEIRSKFDRVFVSDDVAVLEWVSEGRLANGEPVRYAGISVLESESDEKIHRFRAYYDSAALALQASSGVKDRGENRIRHLRKAS